MTLSCKLQQRMLFTVDLPQKQGETNSMVSPFFEIQKRVIFISLVWSENEDHRTLGELFFFLVDEMAVITFCKSLGILIDALMASLQEILKLSDEQLTFFCADFEARLPEYLRKALHPANTAA